MLKVCRECLEEKPASSEYFMPGTAFRGGFRHQCRQCMRKRFKQWVKDNREYNNQRTREWHKRNPHKKKRYDLREKYGIGLEDYNRLLANQNGGCAICATLPTDKQLAVDHDHVTGAVRGLLCSACNIGLGHFRDNPQLLRAAIDYLGKG
jgi:hypothetical protein